MITDYNKIERSIYLVFSLRNRMPKVSAEHNEARRLQIIDAAYRCFARKGFHQATMRDIYQEAQLSPGAIYHYFRSKDAIIIASFERDLQRSLDLFENALHHADSLLALDQLIDFFYTGLASAAELGANRVNIQGWSEALINPEVLDAINRAFSSYRRMLAQLIYKAQQQGVVSAAVDPEAVGRILVSLYLGLELQTAWEPGEVEVNYYTTAVKALLHGSFRQTP
jgi:AcrR family transcriptional regulator